jgi:5'-deoxynucleotidase YfbR-like HD superfamily hydrolase
MEKEEIKKEIDKIIYLYKFKKIIRFSSERVEEFSTESDGEHIFAMMILANYFLERDEYKKLNLNREKVYNLILFHEMDELELGDINTYKKTSEDKKEAIKSLEKVFLKIPKGISKLAEESF